MDSSAPVEGFDADYRPIRSASPLPPPRLRSKHLFVIGVVAVACVGMGVAMAFHTWKDDRQAVTAPTDFSPPPWRTFTRGEFEQAARGRTVSEVCELLGTARVQGEVEVMHFTQVTVNPATGTLDNVTQVVFEEGKAVRVTYE